MEDLRTAEVAGKVVAVRVDLNVPTDASGRVTDDSRIVAVLPTIRHLQLRGARVLLLSHFKRPEGKRDPSMSLEPVAREMATHLGDSVQFAPDCVGPAVEKALAATEPGGVVLLENVRFYPGETTNDPAFARELARPADVFVNDAFGASHRAHASVVGMAALLPAYPGFLLEKEIRALTRALDKPVRPLVAVIGGAKISTKIGVLQNLLGKVDALLLGGGMANTFLAAVGLDMGKSLVEASHLETARAIRNKAADRGVDMVLPSDGVMARDLGGAGSIEVRAASEVGPDWMMVDVGPATLELFARHIANAGTIVWNGPMGVYEVPRFAEGTHRMAQMIAASSAFSILGGGDLVAAVKALGIGSSFGHVSTGGGATLEVLEGKKLPGIAVLD